MKPISTQRSKKLVQISLSDEGFRYGLGIFETLVIVAGHPLFKNWHWEQFCLSAKALGLSQPDSKIFEKIPAQNGIWRWFVTPAGSFEFFEKGIPQVPQSLSLEISPLRLSSQSWDARYKTLSYLLHLQAKQQSQRDEVVLLNEQGEIASAAMANIFWVKNGVIYTPSVDAGCRAGITRRWILEQKETPIVQGLWKLSALQKADEIFLTNSRLGICPVRTLEKQKFPVGKITQKLQELYSEEIC